MFEREKKTDTGDGVTSLIDADMRITGSVISVSYTHLTLPTTVDV